MERCKLHCVVDSCKRNIGTPLPVTSLVIITVNDLDSKLVEFHLVYLGIPQLYFI